MTRSEADGTAEAAPPAPRRNKRDLHVRRFPLLTAEDWREPERVLDQMYLEAEAQAIEAIEWYFEDRRRRKVHSRRLRAGAVLLGAAGGLEPLISVAASTETIGWGYVLLALAGVCIGFDHFLGISSAWMRDMVTAQKLQRRLQQFQLDWAATKARDAAATADEDRAKAEDYLDLLRAFVTDLSTIMIDETTEWVAEFQNGISQLHNQIPPSR